MNVIKAAEYTLNAISEKNAVTERKPSGKSLEHARWMLNGILEGYIQNEKAHRWLGYAQGICVASDYVTLDDMKNANRLAADGDKQE